MCCTNWTFTFNAKTIVVMGKFFKAPLLANNPHIKCAKLYSNSFSFSVRVNWTLVFYQIFE